MNQEVNFDDEEHDALLFSLIFNLEKKNQSRYQRQAEELLKQKVIKIEFNGAHIEFRLTPKGCAFNTNNPQSSQTSHSWTHMGWRNSAKRKALPRFFARAEATVIVDQAS